MGPPASAVRCRVVRILGCKDPLTVDDDLILAADNAVAMPLLPVGSFDLVYMDPPG